MKSLYLACRFSPLILWPVVMYAFLLDHDEKLCKSLVKVVSVIFMILVYIPLLCRCDILLFGFLAILASLYFCSTSMGIHWGNTPIAVYLYTLSICLLVHLILVCVARYGYLEGKFCAIWKDGLLQDCFPWPRSLFGEIYLALEKR